MRVWDEGTWFKINPNSNKRKLLDRTQGFSISYEDGVYWLMFLKRKIVSVDERDSSINFRPLNVVDFDRIDKIKGRVIYVNRRHFYRFVFDYVFNIVGQIENLSSDKQNRLKYKAIQKSKAYKSSLSKPFTLYYKTERIDI